MSCVVFRHRLYVEMPYVEEASLIDYQGSPASWTDEMISSVYVLCRLPVPFITVEESSFAYNRLSLHNGWVGLLSWTSPNDRPLVRMLPGSFAQSDRRVTGEGWELDCGGPLREWVDNIRTALYDLVIRHEEITKVDTPP